MQVSLPLPFPQATNQRRARPGKNPKRVVCLFEPRITLQRCPRTSTARPQTFATCTISEPSVEVQPELQSGIRAWSFRLLRVNSATPCALRAQSRHAPSSDAAFEQRFQYGDVARSGARLAQSTSISTCSQTFPHLIVDRGCPRSPVATPLLENAWALHTALDGRII